MITKAESNTNTIYENAKITDVSLGIGDHCCLTFSIALKGLGWGASFGGYNLAFSMEHHLKVLKRDLKHLQELWTLWALQNGKI